MASKFTNFIISLSNDPQKLDAFNQDPQSVMDAAGLTSHEKNLLLSKDMHAIRSTLVADPGLKQALGISPTQNLPPLLPTYIRVV
jgi:hypothetical protein